VAAAEEGGLISVTRWKRLALAALILGIVGAVTLWLFPDRVTELADKLGPKQDRAAFEQWLAQSPDNRREFAQFEAYLAGQGVDGVVPGWQLTRSDSGISAHCAGGPFVVPPRELWENAVPVLGFVRDKVIPRVGAVEVVSAWRSPRANRCSNGASRSQHLTFAGIDFVTRDKLDNRRLFVSLCGLQDDLGPASEFGLGAYFEPEKPAKNRKGRFHIDLSGFRSWGFGYGAATSGCRALR
jgi:hypothetical protein